ncbi:MAG: ParB N-terminal domain-containing protein [Pseudomonadota bacterium]
MLETLELPIARVRVPVKRRKTLEPERAEALAEDMLEHGQKTPIQVRVDGEDWILIEGLHRLEALSRLGEETVAARVVQARLK